ncbi:hypothetical protein ABRQ22_00520 [Cellulosimicrobium sp. ES-005]|uniref:Transmembrane protein n=1 Tax=Cellulosimicrobium sp. ES-005 TaxID=3163031 RepID=A0AAU8G0L8_9MICO
MASMSEQEVMDALEIDSWRNLSRDKIMRFAALMPEMDREVALAVVSQFPAFTRFALGTLSFLERTGDSTRESNKSSQKHVHDAYRDVREALKGRLAQEDLAPEEERIIIQSMMETADRESAKDTENKQFLESLFNKGALVAGATIAAGLVFVGGKIMLERDERSGGDGS